MVGCRTVRDGSRRVDGLAADHGPVRRKIMKDTLKKISEVFKLIFGYGIMSVLFAGGLTFFGYVIALFIGGETATNICTWIYKSFIPIIIKASTILILFGLFTMYLAGEKALIPDRNSAKHESEK